MNEEEKAAMWDRLMSCPRIRVVGEGGGYMCVEFWHDDLDVDDTTDRKWFARFVRAALGG